MTAHQQRESLGIAMTVKLFQQVAIAEGIAILQRAAAMKVIHHGLKPAGSHQGCPP